MRFERITRPIGAQVFDPSITETVSAATSDALHAALMEHQVLVIPDANLAPRAMAALAESFGPLGLRHHSYVTHEECDDIVVLDWHGDMKPDAVEWHADMTYKSAPPFATFLQAQVVPQAGGDTLWASMYSVLDDLPAGLRADLEGLEAVHDMGAFRTGAYRSGGEAGLEKAMSEAGAAVHPIIAHHPITGRPYLNVSESFTRWIIGLSAPESARLLTILFDFINRPQFHMRLRWRPGTLAIWDNYGTQHYAVADYLPDRRVMHRVVATSDRRI